MRSICEGQTDINACIKGVAISHRRCERGNHEKVKQESYLLSHMQGGEGSLVAKKKRVTPIS